MNFVFSIVVPLKHLIMFVSFIHFRAHSFLWRAVKAEALGALEMPHSQ